MSKPYSSHPRPSNQAYRVHSEAWEHDHCEFCWAKFMDPTFSPASREQVAADPEILTEGYTTTAAHSNGADYHWICPALLRRLRRAVLVAGRRRVTATPA